jgi:hypothetical protein
MTVRSLNMETHSENSRRLVYDLVMDYQGDLQVIESSLSKEMAEELLAAALTAMQGVRLVEREIREPETPWTAE